MKDLPKAYSPSEVEEKWNAQWSFVSDPHSDKPPYCIMMPPPNVTGRLHMGHALVNTLQDILIRWKRMSGYEVLWLPGTDHAGISTQTVVERHLMKVEEKRRTDYPREEFLAHVWKWKEDHEGTITEQLKKLGCSCDWSRQRFTLDEGPSKAVQAAFKKLYEEGLIYQGDYLVHWDTITQTALADDEVEYEEVNSHLWYFRYPVEGENVTLIVATTRPETMLGDTGVAVHPSDERYAKYIGKQVRLPLTNRLVPIFADHRIDPEFGTGVVKITPAHDHNDYEMGFEHNLEMINIMTPDGKINENGDVFQGLSMADARVAVVESLKELGNLEKIEPHHHRVGLSYRSKAIIEPYLSKQWFMKLSAFKEELTKLIHDKEVTLIPSNWENTYFHWIDNLRDWCISRQLWWGHRIPIWYRGDEVHCGSKPEGDGWVQDEDVLDTWFSSALWPFSTLGWPEKTGDLTKFYPNSTLITGHDILFFWVVRMLVMGKYIQKEVPFPETFLHGLIYGKSYWREKEGHIAYLDPEEKRKYDLGEPTPKDVHSKWEKMSKSKGNVVDPLEMIATYGCDAIRLALSASTTHARQIDLDLRRFEEYKNFVNKMWNGARFIFMNLKTFNPLDPSKLALEDRWLLSRLNTTIKEVTAHLSAYEFDHATHKAYDFFWNQFCAYYLEMAKPALREEDPTKQSLLVIALTSILRLLHPFAPYITEELFFLLKERITLPSSDELYTKDATLALSSNQIAFAPFPTPLESSDPQIEAQFESAREIIYTLRTIRGEMQLAPSASTDLYIYGDTDPALEPILRSLIKLDTILYNPNIELPAFTSSASVHDLKLVIPLPEHLREKEIARLKKLKEKLEKQIASLEGQLSNTNFTDRAPKELVDKTRTSLEEAKSQYTHVTAQLNS